MFVEIEFRGRRRVIYANPEQYPLKFKDAVIVQADRGIDLGTVNLTGERWEEQNKTSFVDAQDQSRNGGRNQKGGNKGQNGNGDSSEAEAEVEAPNVEELLATAEGILRLATEEDFAKARENVELETESRAFFREEVDRLNLEMKLIDIECQLDRRKLTFYFTADGRVDFRELVKVLAQKFQTRIDLRQIGARDEAKRLGGIGICGRELCCSSWIREFKPVTTSMMKDQHMVLNPQKNTGPCGKLRCCLRYEVEQYRDLNKLFPKLETRVIGPRGQGIVKKFSYNWEHVGIVWTDGSKYSYGIEHLTECSNWDPENRKKIDVIEFHTDPSLEDQRKQVKEGELVARGEPQRGGGVKASVRSTPKKPGHQTGHGHGEGESCGCGKNKGEGGGKALKRLSDQVNEAHEAAVAAEGGQSGATPASDDDSSSQKSRRSRGRGRGRGRGGRARPRDGNAKQRNDSNKSQAGSKQKSGGGGQPKGEGSKGREGGGTSDGGGSNQPKKSRRRGGRGRGRGGPGNKSGGSSGSGGGGEASGGSGGGKPSGRESSGSGKSGGSGSGGPSSPSSGDKPRPPRSRGRNRRR